jgi:hypothetical protein
MTVTLSAKLRGLVWGLTLLHRTFIVIAANLRISSLASHKDPSTHVELPLHSHLIY